MTHYSLGWSTHREGDKRVTFLLVERYPTWVHWACGGDGDDFHPPQEVALTALRASRVRPHRASGTPQTPRAEPPERDPPDRVSQKRLGPPTEADGPSEAGPAWEDHHQNPGQSRRTTRRNAPSGGYAYTSRCRVTRFPATDADPGTRPGSRPETETETRDQSSDPRMMAAASSPDTATDHRSSHRRVKMPTVLTSARLWPPLGSSVATKGSSPFAGS